VDTVYDLGKILLFIEISQFKDEALKIVRGGIPVRRDGRYLGQSSVTTDEIEEIVDVIGMPEIQFPRLGIHAQQTRIRSKICSNLVDPPGTCFALKFPHKLG